MNKDLVLKEDVLVKLKEQIKEISLTSKRKNERDFFAECFRQFEELEAKANAPQDRTTGTCWFCGGKMIWGGDHNYEDVHGEGEGVVANLSCSECNAEAEFSLREDMGDEDVE